MARSGGTGPCSNGGVSDPLNHCFGARGLRPHHRGSGCADEPHHERHAARTTRAGGDDMSGAHHLEAPLGHLS